jgi:hypothetical protein
MSTLAIHELTSGVWTFLRADSRPFHDIKVWGGRFMLLLITLRIARKVLFSIRKSYLVSPPPILLEHGALPYIEDYLSFSPQNISMLCHASLCYTFLCPLYNLHTWKLNHSQTIWGQKVVLGNKLGTAEDFERLMGTQ